MSDAKRDDANPGPAPPDEAGKPGTARPVDQRTQEEASEEREKEGGYD